MCLGKGTGVGHRGKSCTLGSTCCGTWPLNHWVAPDLEKIWVSQARLRFYQNHFPTEGREDRRPPV